MYLQTPEEKIILIYDIDAVNQTLSQGPYNLRLSVWPRLASDAWEDARVL